MKKIKKRTNTAYLFKQDGGEVVQFHFKKGKATIFLNENQIYDFQDEIFFRHDFEWSKLIKYEQKLYALGIDQTNNYTLFIILNNSHSRFELGEGVQDFLVVNEDVYIIYSEEGIFSSEATFSYGEKAFVKIRKGTDKVIPLLQDGLMDQIVDINAFYYENNTIRLFCYGENKSSYDKFYVDYHLITHQAETHTMPNYNIEGVCSIGDECYLLTNGHILATDKAMNTKTDRLIDEKVYAGVYKVGSAFTEIMMVGDTYFYVLDSYDFKATGKGRR